MTAKKKVAIGLICGVPCVAALVLGGLIYRDYGAVAANLSAENAAAKKDGLPVTVQEFTERLKVPDAENAAPEYTAIFAAMKDSASIQAATKQLRGPSPEPSKAALLTLDPVLARARIAAAKPRCNFERDWAHGTNLPCPEIGDAKTLANALCGAARARSRNGDPVGALKDVAAVQAMARKIGEEPTFLAILGQVAYEAEAAATFDRIVDDHSGDVAFLRSAKSTLEAFGPFPSYRHALIGEYVMARTIPHTKKDLLGLLSELDRDADVMADPELPEPSATVKWLFNFSAVRTAYEDKLAYAYRRLYEACSDNPENWDVDEAAVKRIEEEVAKDHSPSNYLVQWFFQTLDSVHQMVADLIARRHLVDTKLNLLIDRAQRGSFPAELPKYGAHRIDPFSGNPLVYRKEKGGYILYSIGPDRSDDGGRDRASGSLGSNYDIVSHLR